MAKKPVGKKTTGSKGVIPSVKDGIDSAKQGVKDILYGRQAEVSPGKIAEQNRKTGEKIIATLNAVSFSGLKSKETATPEQIKDMRTSKEALVVKIQNAPTIFDDISELDDILMRAADTLKTATELGYANQAEWCINAISTGLLLLRDNVPPQRQEDRKRIIDRRVAYMKNYENLITAYGKIDSNTQAIAQGEDTLKGFEKEYEPKRQKIQEISATPEGMASIARIKANLNQPGKLSDQDRKLEVLGREAGDLASSITRQRNQQFAKIMDNESQLTIAMGFRTALDNLPQLYDQDLLGEYAALLKEINVTTNKLINDAAAVLQVEESAAREMEKIMNSQAAQELAAYSGKAIEKIIMPENRISSKEMLEVQILKAKQERAKRAEVENAQKLAQMMALAQENADVNTVGNQNIDFTTDDNVIVNTNEDTDVQDNKVYNLNS